jgi:glutathione S-transferase
MADMVVGGVLFYLHAMKYDLSRFPSLKKWLDESMARPAAKAAIALRG